MSNYLLRILSQSCCLEEVCVNAQGLLLFCFVQLPFSRISLLHNSTRGIIPAKQIITENIRNRKTLYCQLAEMSNSFLVISERFVDAFPHLLRDGASAFRGPHLGKEDHEKETRRQIRRQGFDPVGKRSSANSIKRVKTLCAHTCTNIRRFKAKKKRPSVAPSAYTENHV